MKRSLSVLGHQLRLPRSVLVRRLLGVALLCGGILGFLPVLGYWMVPLGLLVLSADSPRVRRFRRRLEVGALRAWRRLR